MAARKFENTYMIHICPSHSVSIRRPWIRVPELQLGTNRKRNSFQNNDHYAQSRQHWRVCEAETCLKSVVDKI